MQSEKEFLQGFEEYFGAIKDKRQRSKIDYPLIEILFLSVVEIARINSSVILLALAIISAWPFVIGSNVPGYIPIVFFIIFLNTFYFIVSYIIPPTYHS